MKILLLFIVVAAFSWAGYSQTLARVGITEVYLAKDDGKGNAGDVATTFLPTDIPIYCVVQLDSTEPATVKMNLVAESVPGVKADTKVVSTSYTTRNGENRVNFYGRPAGKWVPGRYRAEIFIEGKLVKILSFEVKGPPSIVAASRFQPPQRKSNKPSPPPRKKPNSPFTAQYSIH